MEKDSFYKLYQNEEKHFKKLYDTLLLSELLRINYEYSTYKYYGLQGNDVWKTVKRKINYSEKEEKEIFKNAVVLLNIKYGYPIRDNILEQFYKLDFNKKWRDSNYLRFC